MNEPTNINTGGEDKPDSGLFSALAVSGQSSTSPMQNQFETITHIPCSCGNPKCLYDDTHGNTSHLTQSNSELREQIESLETTGGAKDIAAGLKCAFCTREIPATGTCCDERALFTNKISLEEFRIRKEPVEGRECWDEENLPFEVAERVVRNRMMAELEKLNASRGTYVPQIKLDLVQFSSSAPRFKWMVQPELMEAGGEGETLEEALANIPKFKTAEEKKAEKIAQLRAELAGLEAIR